MTTFLRMFKLYPLLAGVFATIGGTLGPALLLQGKSVAEVLKAKTAATGFHPHLSPDERCEYETVLANNIYYYLFNTQKQKSIKFEPEDDNDDDNLIPGYKGPSRITATYLWQKEHEEKVKGLLEEFFAKNPSTKRTAGQRNAVTQKLYKAEVSAEDQARYKAMVDEENQNIKAGIRLEGEALCRYYKRLPGTLQKTLNSAHAIGGAHIVLTMVFESVEEPGKFEIHALNTEDMRPFQKDKSLVKAMTAMREFVRQSQGDTADGLCGPPPPEIYPNRRGAWEPLVPNPEGMQAFELLSLHRSFWKRLWAFMGGDCRFPWAEIGKDPRLWLGVGPEELPGLWGDPSGLVGPENKAWLAFFYGIQTGTDLASAPIFLRCVLAANPIDASESEEVSRERYTYNGQEVWLLNFDKPVKKSHARRMEWPATSIEYADYVDTGRTTALLMASNPFGLPVAPSSRTNKVLIECELYETIMSHTDQLSDNAASKLAVLDLVREYNEFAAHLPAETERGAWFGATPPSILPTKPTAIFNILLKRLLPPSYFQSVFKAPKEGTLPHMEEWVELILLGKILWHKKSSTLLGGSTGVIWAVVALIFLIFNFDYVRGDVPLPIQLPEGIDLSRLQASKYPRALEWCQSLTKKLRESKEVLRQSSPQRLRLPLPSSGAPGTPDLPLSSDKTTPLQLSNELSSPVAVPKPTSAAKATKHRRDRKSSKNVVGEKALKKKSPPKKSKRSRKKSSKSESEAEFTDEDSDEENYEEEGSSGSDTSEIDEPDGFAREDSTLLEHDSLRAPTPPIPSLQEDPPAPDNAITLFRKYPSTCKEFNGRNRGNKDEGYMPLVRDPTLRAADCPWGSFPDPVIEVVLPSPLRLDTLRPRMESLHTELYEAIKTWRQAVGDVEKAQTKHCREVLETPNPAADDPDLGPLVATVRAREAIWSFQKARGEHLFPILERLTTISMTSVQFSLAAAELIKRSKNLIAAGIQEATVWREFSKFDQNFRTRIAEARWICEEMEDYALLAAQMRKKFPWFPDSDKCPTFDKPAMHKLAVLCVEWTKVTADLERPMLDRRRRNWSTSGRPFPTAHHEPSKYKFGNAEKQEWHKDLESCLERCSALTPTATPGTVAPIPPVSAAPSVAHHRSQELAPSPNTSPPIPIPNSPTAASGGTRSLSTAPDETRSPFLGTSTPSPTRVPDAAAATGASGGQPTAGEAGMSPNATGLGESVNGKCDPKSTGPTDVTMSGPDHDPPRRSASSSPAPVSSTSPIKTPKVKASKARATKTVPPPEASSETRQTRSGTKRKAEEKATKVQKRTRSKK